MTREIHIGASTGCPPRQPVLAPQSWAMNKVVDQQALPAMSLLFFTGEVSWGHRLAKKLCNVPAQDHSDSREF